MKTSMQLQLLNQTIPLPDLTIGQAMDIAKIAEQYNEKRISALITHLTDDVELAKYLTVQERYYILINHLSLSDNKYVDNDVSYEHFFIDEKTAPNDVEIDIKFTITACQLLGRHVEILEHKCEDLFDWISGAIACQLGGDIGGFVGDNGDNDDWQLLTPANMAKLSDDQLTEIIMDRFEFISSLNEYQYNRLTELFYRAGEQLQHFVDFSFDNKGITILPVEQLDKEEDAGIKPVRFLCLTHLRGTAQSIAQCVI